MVSIFFTIEFFFLKIWYTRFNQLNESEDIKMDILAVSYTHLTLPTT